MSTKSIEKSEQLGRTDSGHISGALNEELSETSNNELEICQEHSMKNFQKHPTMSLKFART